MLSRKVGGEGQLTEEPGHKIKERKQISKKSQKISETVRETHLQQPLLQTPSIYGLEPYILGLVEAS